MRKLRVLITGATGVMGFPSLRALLRNSDWYDLVVIARDTEKNRKLLEPYLKDRSLSVQWGDLLDYEVVKQGLAGCNLVLHIAALVSPVADKNPQLAMAVNYGSTRNIVRAIRDLGQNETTRLVYIGTVAQTGDRMPPIHWGRVGDPIKPSIYDYYAVSKVAAERLVIESGIKHWVSLRQTGIMGPAMVRIEDPIILHNCLDNVLEYCSDRDSARLMSNLCLLFVRGELDEDFWNHIYNIGGGPSCRVDTYTLYKNLFGRLGFTSLDYLLSPKKIATRNFHGQYYLDSDKLQSFIPFQHDSIEYFYESYRETLGGLVNILRALCKIPGCEQHIAANMRNRFDKLACEERGTVSFVHADTDEFVDAFWGSRRNWEKLPEKVSEMKHFSDWNHVIDIDHGYDEDKPEARLLHSDMQGAAAFRGGKLLTKTMAEGDWDTPLAFECAFGHHFSASPRLVLEGGHWCDVCERQSWNYGLRAQVDPFFAQVWNPLHEPDEVREYHKIVSELDV